MAPKIIGTGIGHGGCFLMPFGRGQSLTIRRMVVDGWWWDITKEQYYPKRTILIALCPSCGKETGETVCPINGRQPLHCFCKTSFVVPDEVNTAAIEAIRELERALDDELARIGKEERSNGRFWGRSRHGY